MKLLKFLIPGYGRPRWKIYLWLGWTGMATGSCFLLAAISLAAYESFFLTHSSKAQGIVIANIESQVAADPQTNTAAHTNYCPQFRYESADGATHTVTASTCSAPPSFAIGEQIRVNYSNSDYDHAQIDSFGDQWGLVLGFGLAAVVLLPIGFVLLRRVRPLNHSLDPIGYWDPD
jgi:hypothetical protein